ncbi:MAG: tRNA 2-thiouridine(34) synthase MnmA [Patescibacteria group bacterium]|nr:tRNA 2-thiouridine(34) synthase MnmA [Patescibacteria group bacterium]
MNQIENRKSKIANRRVAVAMSGGVDSSTTAKILKDQGFDCLGVFMRLGIERGCCDEAAARAVCQKIGIKFYPVDVKRRFNHDVKEYFLKAYERGITPNPCVKCNQLIKFGELLKKARALGCDYLATGHYVKLRNVKSRRNAKSCVPGNSNAKSRVPTYKIYRAKDLSKDQTYFLYNLTQEQLKHVIFPMGDLVKEKVKAAAARAKLPNLKTESQDVCFLSGDHNDYLKKYLQLKKGKIVDTFGKIVGGHQGLPLYTIGQRKGVEIGGKGPYYVTGRDFKTNTLYVTNDPDDPALSGEYLLAEKVNWISGLAPKLPFKCSAVIRYHHPEVLCTITKGDRGLLVVKFRQPQRAITPGQSVVFYKKNELLGGGIIK